MDPKLKRLQELLDCILDRSYTDVEQREFAELIDQHHELAPELVDQLRLNSLLRWHSETAKPVVRFDPTADHGQMAPQGGIVQILRSVVFRWRWAAAAAVLLIVATIGTWRPWRVADGRQPTVAEIVDDHRVTWSEKSTALQDGGRIIPGRLEMKAGTLILRFRSGATVSATGFVSMRIVSDMLVLLDRGQATAHVPQWAKGFTIKTPDVEVVDLGTKFGVVARAGGTTDVVVFEGQVDLKPVSNTGESQTRLSQGEGVRINNQGAIDRIVEVRRDIAGVRWTTDQSNWSETTFKSIRDNIPSAEHPTYYQITPHGLEDDCRAYTDCTHEWNGLTSEGLPEFLQHADYVMTRNDYRYKNKLEIIVELARPADLYVFFDHRVMPPDWLTEQFENTGVDIGLDEGPWSREDADPKHVVAVGSGQSIDNVFSVWRRRCSTAETLKLGPIGRQSGARAMYGIAAQPLE